MSWIYAFKIFLGGQVWVSWGAMSISLSLFIFENPIPCYHAVIDNIIWVWMEDLF